MRFDFLRAERPELLERLIAVRLSRSVQTGIAACSAAVVIFAGGWLIEAHRLQISLSAEAVYRARYEKSVALVAETKIRFADLQRRAQLDQRIRGMRDSGMADARRIAEIGNRLPRNSRLTGISRDPDGIVLDGSARDLPALSSAMRAFDHAKYASSPTLLTAAADAVDQPGPHRLKFQIRLDTAQ